MHRLKIYYYINILHYYNENVVCFYKKKDIVIISANVASHLFTLLYWDHFLIKLYLMLLTPMIIYDHLKDLTDSRNKG